MRKLGMLGASVLLMMVAPAIAAENLKDEVDKIGSQYMQFFNKKDAAGITSLYTKNYLRVNQGGVVADNTKLYEGTFKAGFDRLETKAIDVQSVSENVATATGEAHLTGKNEKGEPLDLTAIWSDVLVREDGKWKIKMLTSFPKPPAPPQQASK
jgi:ketosteroid isomerase-like protein